MRTLTRITLVILALCASGGLPEGTGRAAEKLGAPKAPAKVSLTIDRGHTAVDVGRAPRRLSDGATPRSPAP